MIDHHGVAGEEETPREHDAAAVRSTDRRTLRRVEIDSSVRAAWLAVEEAAKPERRSGSALARQHELAPPIAAQGAVLPQRGEQALLVADTAKRRGVGFDVALRHRKTFLGKRLVENLELCPHPHSVPTSHLDGVAARALVEVDANERGR